PRSASGECGRAPPRPGCSTWSRRPPALAQVARPACAATGLTLRRRRAEACRRQVRPDAREWLKSGWSCAFSPQPAKARQRQATHRFGALFFRQDDAPQILDHIGLRIYARQRHATIYRLAYELVIVGDAAGEML